MVAFSRTGFYKGHFLPSGFPWALLANMWHSRRAQHFAHPIVALYWHGAGSFRHGSRSLRMGGGGLYYDDAMKMAKARPSRSSEKGRCMYMVFCLLGCFRVVIQFRIQKLKVDHDETRNERHHRGSEINTLTKAQKPHR
jgi:hypothetical protein